MQIVRRVCQLKNFKNRSIIGKDMDKSKVLVFQMTHGVGSNLSLHFLLRLVKSVVFVSHGVDSLLQGINVSLHLFFHVIEAVDRHLLIVHTLLVLIQLEHQIPTMQ